MTEPRVLLYDIESAPITAYVWQRYNIDNVTGVEQDWYLLSVAWKWLGDKRAQALSLDQCERRDPCDDLVIAEQIHELFDQADIVVAHNGNRFDQAKARTRMAVHGLAPPSRFQEVDTLMVARGNFAFSSNKLDDLGEALGLGRKMDTGGFGLWLGCMADDPRAWAKMRRYNRSDVELLEAIYLALRPWMPRHPNMALIADRPNACPKCGSEEGMVLRRYKNNAVTRRAQYQCKACGGYCSGGPLEKPKLTYRPTYVP